MSRREFFTHGPTFNVAYSEVRSPVSSSRFGPLARKLRRVATFTSAATLRGRGAGYTVAQAAASRMTVESWARMSVKRASFSLRIHPGPWLGRGVQNSLTQELDKLGGEVLVGTSVAQDRILGPVAVGLV